MSYAGPRPGITTRQCLPRVANRRRIDVVVEGSSSPSVYRRADARVDQPHVRSDACQESEQRNSRNHGLLSRFLLCNCSYAVPRDPHPRGLPKPPFWRDMRKENHSAPQRSVERTDPGSTWPPCPSCTRWVTAMYVPYMAIEGRGGRLVPYVWQGFGCVLRAYVHMFTWAQDVKQRAPILKPLATLTGRH